MRLKIEVLSKAVRALYRDGKGLSKPQIGSKAGLSHGTIFHVLKGDQKTTLETWDKIHRAFPDRIPELVFETAEGKACRLVEIQDQVDQAKASQAA